MDADLSHDPADLPRLLKQLEDHDAVVGSRYVARQCHITRVVRGTQRNRFAVGARWCIANPVNDGGEAWHGANLRVAFGQVPKAQRLYGGCSHGTLPRVASGGEPRRDWTAAVGRALVGTAGAG